VIEAQDPKEKRSKKKKLNNYTPKAFRLNAKDPVSSGSLKLGIVLGPITQQAHVLGPIAFLFLYFLATLSRPWPKNRYACPL